MHAARATDYSATLALVTLLLTGCVSTSLPPAHPEPPTPMTTDESADGSTPETPIVPVPPMVAAPEVLPGNEIALRAIALVGTPYRYGGADLHGFDCSGMVYYLHRELGLSVPRTAADQARAAEPIDRDALLPGDLVFFKIGRSKRVSHVGVYVGDNRFVHAPQSGKRIELRNLDDAYYGSRLTSTGRLIGTP